MNRRPMIGLAGVLVCASLMLSAAPSLAAKYALLVGVGEVAALPRRLWLRGPDNDVALVRQTLLMRGFAADHITVLASLGAGPFVHARPTRAAIARAMAEVLARAQPGDQVVLHLAGHGAQVPQAPDSAMPEPDGLDEVFLTADTQPWNATQQRLPNALLDDEIGAWIDALVDRGAVVWAIFDTCHAEGMSRGERNGPRLRSVAAAELGVPAGLPARPKAVAGKPAALPAAQRLDGRVLAFAARGHEATAEEWLPRGAGLLKARLHGVFSHAVALALQGGVTDVQGLRSALQQRYAQDGRRTPVPLVIGLASAPLP